MQAVGMYLRLLRERRNLSVMDIVSGMKALVPELDTNPTYIWRIEHGKIESPGARLLVAFTRVVGGNLDDIADLLLSKRATAEDGQRRADLWLAKTNSGDVDPALGEQDVERSGAAEGEFDKLAPDEIIDLMIELSNTLRDKLVQ